MSGVASYGRTIRLFLVEGTPTGIITAEVGNWTGKVLVAPRTSLPTLKGRDEAKRTGVYLLLGPDPADPFRERIYVGESDDVVGRLDAHDAMTFLKTVTAVTPSNFDKVTGPDELPAWLCNYVNVYKTDRITGEVPFMVGAATPSEVRRFALGAGDALITKDYELPADIAVLVYVEADGLSGNCSE
jgi:hypothetical protein